MHLSGFLPRVRWQALDEKEKRRKSKLYAVALAATMGGVISQYVIPSSWIPGGNLGFVIDLLIVYGVGLAFFYAFFGTRPLRNFVRRPGKAVKETIRWYGILSILGLLVALILIIVYLAIEPSRAEYLLSKTTSVDQAGASNPLFYILFSIFFVGFVEETLFRGYVFGSLLTIEGTHDWRMLAVSTSLIFAGVHLYYAQTYLEVSPTVYVRLFALGLAFSYAYVLSGGNLLMVSLMHGGYDAVAFFSLTPYGATYATYATYLFLLAAALYAAILYYRKGDLPLYTGGLPGKVPETWDGKPSVEPEDWPPLLATG